VTGADERHDLAVAAEVRSAARLLLAHPLVTATGPHAADFRLVRAHADTLRDMFARTLGYRLIVEASFARLVKAGLGPGAGRPLRTSTDRPFTPRMYAYLALALSALVTAPDQMLLSQLVTAVRAAAVDAGIDLGDAASAAERRALAAALRQLVGWGVLAEVDGTVTTYADDADKEALLSVERDVARHLVGGPLRQASSPAELIALAVAAGPGGPRHAVRRRLLETPVAYLDDLDVDSRAWLRREQRREERWYADAFGLDTEIRAEGVALVDPDDELTDLAFPGSGTVAQAALLAVGRLAAMLRPAPERPGTRRLTIGVPVPDGALEEILAAVTAEYAKPCGWAQRYVEDPAALRAQVLALLGAMRLLVPAGGQVADLSDARGDATTGLVLLAAAARYEPRPGAEPGARRARRARRPVPTGGA
jgi:uncharacterized protein (TIGR02678 family)